MEKNIRSKIYGSLRKIWLHSEVREKALNLTKSNELVGEYKNGKPKYLIHHKCCKCLKKYPAIEKQIQVDHIKPVLSPSVGFNGWDSYINRLLYCDVKDLQVMCKRCHKIKTKREK